MNEQDSTKSLAERWFEEQQAWQKTMRDYADAMAKDEDFLTNLGNAMHGSLLAGTPYPTPPVPGSPAAQDAKPSIDDRLDELIFTMKRVEGRLRDLEDAVRDLEDAATSSQSASRESARRKSE